MYLKFGFKTFSRLCPAFYVSFSKIIQIYRVYKNKRETIRDLKKMRFVSFPTKLFAWTGRPKSQYFIQQYTLKIWHLVCECHKPNQTKPIYLVKNIQFKTTLHKKDLFITRTQKLSKTYFVLSKFVRNYVEKYNKNTISTWI